jgi:dihydroxy-acid dehydratase
MPTASELFLEAGHRIVDLAKRYYEQDDESVLPRGIATFEAFENAMTLDIAMGGSTNTVLHLLAAPTRARSTSPWTTSTACRARCRTSARSRRRVARSPHGRRPPRRRHHGILGELDRAGLLDTSVPTVHSEDHGEALAAGTSPDQ